MSSYPFPIFRVHAVRLPGRAREKKRHIRGTGSCPADVPKAQSAAVRRTARPHAPRAAACSPRPVPSGRRAQRVYWHYKGAGPALSTPAADFYRTAAP
jgi:hypothetical protein